MWQITSFFSTALLSADLFIILLSLILEVMDRSLNYCYAYPRPAVTTDCVVFAWLDDMLQVLLIERAADPFKGSWAFPGGFLDMDECALAGAQRELHEETGLQGIHLEQLHTFSSVARDPRGRTISVVFWGAVNQAHHQVVAGDDARRASWFPVSAVPPLAFDHSEIFQLALRHLRFQMRIRPIFHPWLPEVFTVEDILSIYRSVMAVRYDPHWFEQQLLDSSLLIPMDDGGYRFNYAEYASQPNRDYWFFIQ